MEFVLKLMLDSGLSKSKVALGSYIIAKTNNLFIIPVAAKFFWSRTIGQFKGIFLQFMRCSNPTLSEFRSTFLNTKRGKKLSIILIVSSVHWQAATPPNFYFLLNFDLIWIDWLEMVLGHLQPSLYFLISPPPPPFYFCVLALLFQPTLNFFIYLRGWSSILQI